MLGICVQALNNENIVLNDDVITFKNYTLLYDKIFKIFRAHEHDFTTLHLLNLLKDYNNENSIFYFLEKMTEINIYNKCVMCKNDILDVGALSTCLNCFEDSLTVLIDDTVTNYSKENFVAFDILLTSAFECLNDTHADLILDDLPKIINKNEIVPFGFDIIKKKNLNDFTLFSTIGHMTYYFVKYIIKKNIVSLKKHTDVIDKKNNKEMHLLSVIHHNVVIDKFKNGCGTLLYHGSSLSNWTSIFKNGLKNYSKSKLQRNGAAYGDGVYLADTPQFASGYSSGHWILIAVVKVLDDIQQYKKTTNIFVVPDETKLMIQYVICSKSQSLFHLNEITEIIKNVSTNTVSVSLNLIQQKRIKNEFKKITIPYEEKNTGYYVLFLETCEVSIILSNEYPLKPPFVWFNKINFEHEKILSHGALFLQELFIPNWSSSTLITKIIEMIQSIIIPSDLKYNYNDYEPAINEYNDKLRLLNII